MTEVQQPIAPVPSARIARRDRAVPVPVASDSAIAAASAGTGLLVLNSITQAGPAAAGQVVVAGSHGGLVAGAYAAAAGLRAVIFNDAGVGLEGAGIGSLQALDEMGMAAACVARLSAPMGDGLRVLVQGVISHANVAASAAGVQRGQPCAEAVRHLLASPLPRGAAYRWREGRYCLQSGSWIAHNPADPAADIVHPAGVARRGRARMEGHPEVWACDSVAQVLPQDAGCILVVGSHAALHAGPASALPVQARAAFFHDAGSWGEPEGLSRLPVLGSRGIPCAAVHHASARIGDARSMVATGLISFLNAPARGLGWRVGMPVREAIALVGGLGGSDARHGLQASGGPCPC